MDSIGGKLGMNYYNLKHNIARNILLISHLRNESVKSVLNESNGLELSFYIFLKVDVGGLK